MTTYTAQVKLKTNRFAKINYERLAYSTSLLISIFSVLYLLTVLISGSSWLPFVNMDVGSSNLTLALLECFLAVGAIHVPMLVKKLTKIKIPSALCGFFYIFVLCATVLGELFSLYYRVPVWDSLLHCGSGIMAGMLGSILLVNYLKKKNCQNLISPLFIAICAICFAISVGVVWEMYEFAADYFMGLNMQKFMLQDGTALLGQAALLDTMKDLLVDSSGALIAAVASFVSLKQRKGWLHACLANNRQAAKGITFEKAPLQESA